MFNTMEASMFKTLLTLIRGTVAAGTFACH
jgi:hypothetical protein